MRFFLSTIFPSSIVVALIRMGEFVDVFGFCGKINTSEIVFLEWKINRFNSFFHFPISLWCGKVLGIIRVCLIRVRMRED